MFFGRRYLRLGLGRTTRIQYHGHVFRQESDVCCKGVITLGLHNRRVTFPSVQLRHPPPIEFTVCRAFFFIPGCDGSWLPPFKRRRNKRRTKTRVDVSDFLLSHFLPPFLVFSSCFTLVFPAWRVLFILFPLVSDR